MQEYKLKRGFSPDIERMYTELSECFPSEIKKEDGKLITSYGALSKLSIWMDGKILVIDTVSDIEGVDDENVLDTNKRFREFLNRSTGYSAKERAKKAKKNV
ncbi:MAG: DUF5611 family protein [Methanosarcinaceae archaeon]|nr:DUF5611 family protein [Methanosarcinaceae archaeon]